MPPPKSDPEEESSEESSSEESSESSPAQSKKPTTKAVPVKSKFAGEDEEEDEPASDWEDSSDEEEKKPAAPASNAAPPKKKGTLKAKIAEKEAAKAERRANGEDSDEYDSDAVLDPREKARRDKERELKSDLNNAADLLGTAALGGTSSKELDSIISFQPRTKEDFIQLSDLIVQYVIQKHENKPLYAAFIEHHARALCLPLKDVEIRKVASGLTALSNEKQKEARDKASGKKKPKSAGKPILGAAKAGSRVDTGVYDESLDDFGDNDFM